MRKMVKYYPWEMQPQKSEKDYPGLAVNKLWLRHIFQGLCQSVDILFLPTQIGTIERNICTFKDIFKCL